ncbi:hypothetical protein EJB05_56334, partial [Eragrostis curvula]
AAPCRCPPRRPHRGTPAPQPPPAPLRPQHRPHQRLRLPACVPLPYQPHLRRLVRQQAHRHDPVVAAEAAVPDLLRRLEQLPRSSGRSRRGYFTQV